MNSYSYDLHIHSCLSPCGDADMTPENIVGMAALKGLDVIAVTDHNSCKNCPAVFEAAKGTDITVISGMEICTSEEVHALCLFEHLEEAMAFDSFVYSKLPPIKNRTDIFGSQLICGENDSVKGEEPLLLINGADISIDELCELTSQYGGIAIPAHIEKSSNSLTSNLGFIPPDTKFRCMEVKNIDRLAELQGKFPLLSAIKIISNSDAHYLEHISEAENFIHAESKSAADILNALNTIKSVYPGM